MRLRALLLAAALALFAAPALATEPPGIISGANVDFTAVPNAAIPCAALTGGCGSGGATANTPFSLNINSTFNGVDYTGCTASVSCTFYINGAPALAGSFGPNPTVRIDRSPTGTGGISADDTFTLEVVLNAPATDSWTENAGFFILNNRSVAANATQSAALLVQAFKQGSADVGSTFGAAIATWDSTGVANPTHGLQGLEIDLAFGVPGAEVNAGADPNVTRQILKLVCSGVSGTHCGLGEAISTFFAGDVIDTGICFGSGCPGGNGTFAVGINMTGTYSTAAILFSALSQDGISWTNTSGVYSPTSAGAQIFSDTSNNLDIANYNGTAINFFTSSGIATAQMTSAGLTLPAIAGATQCIQASSTGLLSGTGSPCGTSGGTVASVTNSDGTLAISPTTGSVVASLNLAHANTWTAAISEAQTAGASVPALSVVAANHSAFSVPGAQIIANVDYGSFGDANTTFGLVVGGGKNVDTGATTGSWQLFSARYTGFGGGDGSAFITAGQELMLPTAGTNNNSGRFFGNNPECIIPTGMTPTECTGEEIDIKTLSSPSGDRHGLRIIDIGSTGSHATDDSGLSILSSGIGWTTGIEFGTPSGSFPVVAGGALVTTAASSAALNAGIYLQNLTGTPTLAWLALPANTRGLCFGVGNCAAGSVVSTTTSGSGSLVFANGDISINFAAAEVTFTSTGSIQMLGGINAPNATGGTATKFICSDTSGNWFAQTAAC